MNQTIRKIETILTSQYDVSNYTDFIREIFPAVQIVAPDRFHKEYTNFSSHIEGSAHVGNYTDPDGKTMIIFAVQLKKESYVENSRSTQRSYAKKLMEAGNADAAIVAFYTEGDPKWRLSFVRLDYEIKFENGKLNTTENMTPAKRYSYLVGQDEPCHTAISRFRRFIIDDPNAAQPTLDDLEEAFSVEKVTEEFFNLYCEKFHQLRESLEANPDFVIEAKQHNFTSAQFAKKLMGQIVFLYFLQKKGWLGVSAWPKEMNAKEYKNAFYARGAKSRELIPRVYVQVAEDKYKLSGRALDELSDADETVLASCVKGNAWGTGSKTFMRTLFDFSQRKQANFFDDFLEPLFYNALNVNRGEQGYAPALHCRIPFLSGGLFEPIDGYDWEHNDFAIPNSVFSNKDEKGDRDADGILDIFDRYNFTMSEDEPLEREVAIDPEMLGKVFENLLEVKDRKSKGAFYTPREIVHYMCQESLISYLIKETGLKEQDIRDFILLGDFMKDKDTAKNRRQGEHDMLISEKIYKIDQNGNVVVNRLKDIDNALANIRVADPAVGSGAFPLGMLNEIVRARQNISAYMAITMNAYQTRNMYNNERSPYSLKLQTIKNCIFAADIEPSAVDITQLRLWLSLVIDDEINPEANSPLDGHKNPIPLPNLECNIVCGNSLVDEFEGIKLINFNDAIGTSKSNQQQNMFQNAFDAILPSLLEAQDALFRCDDTTKKQELKKTIESLKDELVKTQMTMDNTGKYERYLQARSKASRPFVLWQIDFARVFQEQDGFDVVIGNPPYVDSEEMTKSMPELRKLYSSKYECAKGNWDLFVLFIEKGMNLLHQEATISYIVPNKLVAAPYTKILRKKISEQQVQEMRDYSSVTVFKSAAVYPVVFRVKICEDKIPVTMDVMGSMENIINHNVITPEKFYADINWDKYFNSSAESLEIVEKMSRNATLNTIAEINGAATVSEAYLVKEFLKDDEKPTYEYKKFINTGGIDPYKSFFGIDDMRYLKGKYLHPVVPTEELKKMSEKRLKESNEEKIIVGGMNKKLECYYDYGEYLAGKSTTIIYGCEHLKYITALMNSRLMSFYYSVVYNSMTLAGGFFRIGAPQLKGLPIAIPEDKELILQIEKTVDNIQEILRHIVCTDEDNKRLQTLTKEIDIHIYNIYGLSEAEVAYVENER